VSKKVYYRPCPHCDERVGGPGIGQHQKSLACQTRQQVNKLREQGLLPADVGEKPTDFLKNLCIKMGIEAQVAPVKVERKKLYYATFLPEWAANLWRRSTHLDYRTRLTLLQRGQEDETFRWAICGAALAGPEQIGQFLTMQSS